MWGYFLSLQLILPSNIEPVEAEILSDRRCSRKRGKKLLLKWQWNTCRESRNNNERIKLNTWNTFSCYSDIFLSELCTFIALVPHPMWWLYYLNKVHWHKPLEVLVFGELFEVLFNRHRFFWLGKWSISNIEPGIRESKRGVRRRGKTATESKNISAT